MSNAERWEKPHLHNRLRFKLISFYALIILCGSAIALYSSIKIADNELRKILIRQFKATLQITENLIEVIGQTGLIWCNNMVSDNRLNRLLVENNRGAMVNYVVNAMENSAADALILLDKSGRVLVRGHDIDKYGDSLIYLTMVREAIQKHIPSTYILQEAEIFIIYSSGVIYNEDKSDILGAMLLGYTINDRFVEKIKENIDVDITIIRERGVMASTIYDENNRISVLPIPYLEYQMLLNNRNNILETNLFGKGYFITAKNLAKMDKSMSGSILLAYPQDSIIAIKKSLYRDYLFLFASGFLIVVVVGIKFSKKILNPIHQLISITNRVAKGEFDSHININTEDEINILARDFNYMIDSIREKNDALKRYAEDLEVLVKERTEELVQVRERLFSYEKMAMLGQITGNIAHEILNPVSAVISRMHYDIGQTEVNKNAISAISTIITEWENNYKEGRLEAYFNNKTIMGNDNERTYLAQDIAVLNNALAKAKELAEEQRHSLLFYHNNIQRIVNIVEDVKGIARISMSIEAFNIHTAMSQTIELLSFLIAEQGIKITQDIGEDIPDIHADLNEIIQVTTNIIKNAIQAIAGSNNKRRNIVITAKKTSTRVEIRFTDSGVGIREEDIPKLFLPAFTTKSKEGGMGLGLAISRKIIRNYGGDVEIEYSKYGEGTTILVWLPIAIAIERRKDEQ